MTASPSVSAGRSIPFDPKRFYQQAKRMARSNNEASLRTAVGRAYYAMYLIAHSRPSVLAQMQITPFPRNGGLHEHLANAITGMPGLNATGNQLKDLKRLRHIADYKMNPPQPDANWSNNWQIAKTLADALLPVLSTI